MAHFRVVADLLRLNMLIVLNSGLGILTPDGRALTVNEHWRNFTQLKQGDEIATWETVLVDPPSCYDAWERVIRDKKPVTMQAEMKSRWETPDLDAEGNKQYDSFQILLTMYPDIEDNGEVVTVMSCITDISDVKYREKQLLKKMEQAIEMKKQQERFIDMTSHEMRNPLSALIGCADEIISALKECREITETRTSHATDGLSEDSQQQATLLTESLENAETIIYCALHQKRSKSPYAPICSSSTCYHFTLQNYHSSSLDWRSDVRQIGALILSHISTTTIFHNQLSLLSTSHR